MDLSDTPKSLQLKSAVEKLESAESYCLFTYDGKNFTSQIRFDGEIPQLMLWISALAELFSSNSPENLDLDRVRQIVAPVLEFALSEMEKEKTQ